MRAESATPPLATCPCVRSAGTSPVDDAYTDVNIDGIPPWRAMSRSSMQSAPGQHSGPRSWRPRPPDSCPCRRAVPPVCGLRRAGRLAGPGESPAQDRDTTPDPDRQTMHAPAARHCSISGAPLTRHSPADLGSGFRIQKHTGTDRRSRTNGFTSAMNGFTLAPDG